MRENGGGPDGGADSGLLLVVGAGERRFREYIFRQVSRRFPMWLMASTELDWALPYVQGWTEVDLADHTDPEPLLKAVLRVAAHHRVGGVLCFEEGLIWLASHATERLGLRGLTPAVAWRCRDKASTRAVLAEAGVPQPQAALVATRADIDDAARRIGFPLVVKPRALGGGIGVRRVDDWRALEAAYLSARAAWGFCPGAPTFEAGVMVEAYLDGPEITVDSIVYRGRVDPVVITRKETVFAPHFEDACHVFDGTDPLLRDPILREHLDAVHRALGVTDGATLTQWRMTPAGPRLIEINARLGGDLLPYLGGIVTGTSPATAAAEVALGLAPQLRRQPSGAAIISFLHPDDDLTVLSLEVVGELPAGVHVELMAARGDELRLPPRGFKSRLGYISALGETVPRCRALVDVARRSIRLQSQPLPKGSAHAIAEASERAVPGA